MALPFAYFVVHHPCQSVCIRGKKIPKVAFSGFLLGNREKIAVVANDDFSRRAGNMAEKMNRQAPTSNLQRDSKLQNAFGALVIGNSLVLGSWVLEVARETHALPNPHSFASIHPPQDCYGGRAGRGRIIVRWLKTACAGNAV